MILCDVYKSAKVADTYIYVDHQRGLEPLPPELLDRFPEPIKVLQFKLEEGKRLARVDAKDVMLSISDKGYYLQMPPPANVAHSHINQSNNLMPR